MPTTARDRAHLAVLAASALLVVTLFLPWHQTTWHLGVAFDVVGRSSGWTGWGVLAGIAAIAVVAAEMARTRGLGEHAVPVMIGALAALLGTALAVFSTTASVHLPGRMMMSMGAGADTTRWPAWVGLGLAVVAAAASIVVVVLASRPPVTHPRAGRPAASPGR
jgi:hypothetical protein